MVAENKVLIGYLIVALSIAGILLDYLYVTVCPQFTILALAMFLVFLAGIKLAHGTILGV
ncbi:MAG: hypothetical protein ABH829_03515 [archaeon]